MRAAVAGQRTGQGPRGQLSEQAWQDTRSGQTGAKESSQPEGWEAETNQHSILKWGAQGFFRYLTSNSRPILPELRENVRLNQTQFC